VAAFLAGHIRFPDIATVVEAVLNSWQPSEPSDLDAVQHADRQARILATDQILAINKTKARIS